MQLWQWNKHVESNSCQTSVNHYSGNSDFHRGFIEDIKYYIMVEETVRNGKQGHLVVTDPRKKF